MPKKPEPEISADEGPITALWESYKIDVIPKAAGPVQIEECRRAFYSGAHAMLCEVVRIADFKDRALESAALAHVQADMDEFLKSILPIGAG